MKNRMTVKQYKAALIRATQGLGITDLEFQGNYWPYPQADQSHLAVWRKSMPKKRIEIPVVNTDISGALIRMGQNAPSPSVTAKMIKDIV